MSPAPAPLDGDACYLALKTRDARFDGHFFTGVRSTGIYCRPVCKVRTPKAENCRFFALAAQAESEGFRPCLRCRPELAPAQGPVWSTQDASALLAQQAAQLLDALTRGDMDGDVDRNSGGTMTAVAARLGVSARHLRRIFEAQWGISPLQYLQTRRLLCAKQLLTDTTLPVSEVAHLSGFASLRRFNAAFVAHYRLQPRALRREGAQEAAAPKGGASGAQIAVAGRSPHAQALQPADGIHLRAAYRPPYDVPALLAFLQQRAIPGVEEVDLQGLIYRRTIAVTTPGQSCSGWVQARFVPGQCAVEFLLSASLLPALAMLMAGLRQLLDLDADPAPIAATLGPRFAGLEGLRLPGTLDGLELAVRGILGQQITVAAARTLASRLVQALGQPVATPFAALTHLFPGAQQLAAANSESLGALGIVRQRQAAIASLAQAVAHGAIQLRPGADVAQTLAALQALPGIGPWTAHYIAMRALRWPDAFVAGDVALHKALGLGKNKAAAQEAHALAQAWRPWRSYAVIRAWHTLASHHADPAAATPPPPPTPIATAMAGTGRAGRP
jgi:AraC family transcriptional regulator of adaptative response / DNA-3-methyladenine glycosylase II